MSKTKIVLIGNIPSFLILFRHELVLELVSRNYEVYCLANGYSQKEKEIVKSWGAIPMDHSLDVKGLNPISDLKATYKLYRVLTQIKPDIVLASFVKPVIFSAIAAKFAKVKNKVGMIEGLGNAFTNYKSGFSRKAKLLKKIQVLLYKFSLPLLDKVILLNTDDKIDLIDTYKIPVKSLDILGGIGVDLDKFAYSKPTLSDNITFLFIGRLVEAKGIFEFIEAAKLVKDQHPKSVFRVIGGFDEDNPFSIGKDALNQYVTDGLIEYKGHVDDVITEIQNSHVFVLPSYREGVPRSTQEAMAIGRAVITTNTPGCNITVTEGKNGFLVAPWDIDDLANKMMRFSNNPELIHLMGIESRKIAESKFNIHKVNDALINIINH